MKKLFTILIFALMASTAFAAGPQSPLPVVVRLSQEAVVKVTLTSLNTGEVVETYTADDGQALFELANLEKGYLIGHSFRVDVLGVSKTFKIDGTSSVYFVDVDVNAQLSTKCVVNEYPSYGQVIQNDQNNCQIYIKAPEYVPVKCTFSATLKPGETTGKVDDECDVTLNTEPADYSLQNILLVILAAGGGYITITRAKRKAVKFRVYSGKLQHSHANYTTYHSPDAVHSYQPHPKGELEPKYSSTKNSAGKYDYLGG